MGILGHVKIQLDVPRRLRYDANAMAELTDYLGEDKVRVIQSLTKAPLSTLRAVLWAGLIHDDEELAIYPRKGVLQVGRLIDKAPGKTLPDKMVYVGQKIEEAIIEAFPEFKDALESAKKKGSPEMAGTGTKQNA